jgi:hypothetical protein
LKGFGNGADSIRRNRIIGKRQTSRGVDDRCVKDTISPIGGWHTRAIGSAKRDALRKPLPVEEGVILPDWAANLNIPFVLQIGSLHRIKVPFRIEHGVVDAVARTSMKRIRAAFRNLIDLHRNRALRRSIEQGRGDLREEVRVVALLSVEIVRNSIKGQCLLRTGLPVGDYGCPIAALNAGLCSQHRVAGGIDRHLWRLVMLLRAIGSRECCRLR